MDYGLLNAIAITIMAAFGLWAFQKGAPKKRPRDKEHKDS